MTTVTHPSSFHQPTTDAAAKDHQRKGASLTCQAPRGVSGIVLGANGEQVRPYSDPQGTVFIDRESHGGAWVRYLKDVSISGHGDSNAK